MKLQLFPIEGKVNNVFNDFANFIFTRKSLSAKTEKKFIKKLEYLQGLTNSPLSMLQQRINNNEINLNIPIAKGIINEMKSIIIKHNYEFN